MKRLLSLLLAIVMCLSLVSCGETEDHTGQAKTPSGSSVQAGRNYLDVIEDFEEHGFTNIRTEEIDDLIFGWLTEEGEVEDVAINGDTEYSPDKWVPADSEVIIRYHVFPSDEDETETATDPSEDSTTEPEVTDEPTSEPESTENPTTEPETTEPGQIPAGSTFSIHYIDVGQADAALVECDGHYMLIDGGNKEDSSLIYSVLKSASVSKLDIVVGTHAHEDHIGGIPGAYNYTTADLTLCPVTSYDSEAFEDFKTYADKNGGGITIPSVGDTYSLGSATIEILGVNGGSDPNNTSIVLMITYGSTSFLFTGDAEREAEQAILNRGADLSATVLKVGHHGSDTSTTYPFLREIMPQYAIISVGEGNSYGHPTDDNLSRLRDADVTVYRTDLNGDIFLTSDGQTVSITSDKTVSQEEIMTPGSTYVAPPVVTEPDPEPEESTPTGTDYIVNTNTGKFHYPSCGSVKKMKESNKMYYTGTRDELIAKGYDPCGNCHP